MKIPYTFIGIVVFSIALVIVLMNTNKDSHYQCEFTKTTGVTTSNCTHYCQLGNYTGSLGNNYGMIPVLDTCDFVIDNLNCTVEGQYDTRIEISKKVQFNSTDFWRTYYHELCHREGGDEYKCVAVQEIWTATKERPNIYCCGGC